MNLVSVLIPCYNAGNYIQDAVSSVLDQGNCVGEILIFDDASNSETIRILKQLEEESHLITVHYSDENEGAGEARSFLISQAKFPYCAFLDADDVWTPHKLEIQLVEFINPAVLVCFSSYYICDENLIPMFVKLAIPRVGRRALLFANHIPNSTAVFRTELAKSIIYPKIRRRQDYAFWLKLFTQYPNAIAVGIKKPLMKYRKVEGSLSSSPIQNLKYNYCVFHDELGLNPIAATTYVAINIYNRYFNNRLSKL